MTVAAEKTGETLPSHPSHGLGGDSIFKASVFNVGARCWEAVVNLGTVPVLLAHLGTEAYGLVGFTQSIFAVLGLLDFGLSNAVNRELAKREVDAAGARVIRALVRSLELPVLGAALLLALVLVSAAGFFASEFLRVESMGEAEVTFVIQLSAGVFLFRWLSGFYRGVFFGLERQVRYNIWSIVYVTIRFVGGAWLLAAGHVGVVGLFIWYLASDAAFFAAVRWQVWRFEEAGSRVGPAFSVGRLRGVLPYALGTMGLAVVGMLVMQVDKLLIARFRPLSELGAYAFAFTLAMGVRFVPGAVWVAAFPRLVHALAVQNSRATAEMLTAVFRVTTISALALAAPLAVFAPDIVETLGARSPGIGIAAPLLAVLAIGAFVESLNAPCYQQMLAAGHARHLLRLNLVINLVFVAAVSAGIAGLGVIGVALCWPPLQLSYFILYARSARTLGGPDLAGALRGVTPVYSVVMGAVLMARLASWGSSALVGTGVAAGVSALVHLGLGWHARTHRGGVLMARSV